MRATAAGRNLKRGEFYGRVLRKHEGGGFVLSELRHETGRALPEHSHELAYFCLLLGGGYTEQLSTRRRILYTPFTLAFHPPGTSHRDEIGRGGGRFFSVEIGDGWMARLREYASDVPRVTVASEGGELVWLATRLYREYSAMDACSPLAIEGLVLEMLARTVRGQVAGERRAPRWLSKAMEMLRADFRRNLTVGEVAAEVGVHPFHLSKVFRRFHRQSIGDYVHGLRIQSACAQLSDPSLDLTAIALANGFADQSHFTRVFKQLTGTTPGALRTSLKK